jgi:hypothetical protein
MGDQYQTDGSAEPIHARSLYRMFVFLASDTWKFV